MDNIYERKDTQVVKSQYINEMNPDKLEKFRSTQSYQSRLAERARFVPGKQVCNFKKFIW